MNVASWPGVVLDSPGALGQGAEDPFHRARAERDSIESPLTRASSGHASGTKTPPDTQRAVRIGAISRSYYGVDPQCASAF